jgi:hypothetical protein
MIYMLPMRKRSKSVDDLLLKYLTKRVLLEKKLKISYKVRINYLNLLPTIPYSLIIQHLYHIYAQDIDAVIAILLGIGGINVLIVLVINFLYIIVMLDRKSRIKISILDAVGEKWAGRWWNTLLQVVYSKIGTQLTLLRRVRGPCPRTRNPLIG